MSKSDSKTCTECGNRRTVHLIKGRGRDVQYCEVCIPNIHDRDTTGQSGCKLGLDFQVERIRTMGEIIGTLEYHSWTRHSVMDLIRFRHRGGGLRTQKGEERYAFYLRSDPEKVALVLGEIGDGIADLYRQGWQFRSLSEERDDLREIGEAVAPNPNAPIPKRRTEGGRIKNPMEPEAYLYEPGQYLFFPENPESAYHIRNRLWNHDPEPERNDFPEDNGSLLNRESVHHKAG